MSAEPSASPSRPTRLRVVHRTEYRYSSPVSDGFTLVTLLPRPTPRQEVLSAQLIVDPAPDEREEAVDVFGNRQIRLAVHRPHRSLEVTADSVVDIDPPSPAAGRWPTLAEAVELTRCATGPDALEVDPFLRPSRLAPRLAEIDAFAAPLADPNLPLPDVAAGLSTLIHQAFRFDPDATDVSTPLAEVMAGRHGVCQDFAHVGVSCARALGLAARYVSGYIETSAPPGQAKLVGADASHAWCSVWAPGVGWTDFDPTNDQAPPPRHVTVAWARDYADLSPLRGVLIGPVSGQELTVAVDVTPAPRP
ncbi:MAG: transglutaminase N-terminal domain-containing protein [Acidimicrobiales bacterium]